MPRLAMIAHGSWRFEREEDLDEALRQRGQTGFAGALETAELIRWADTLQRWAKTGHGSLSDYLARRCGIAYRSYRRAMAVVEALEAVPEEYRDPCRALLIQLGSHRAGALAPWIRERGPATTPQDLKPWLELAEAATEEAFQEQVNETRGLPATGRGDDPGAKFLTTVLQYVPPERADWVRRVFETVMRVEQTNPIGALLLMADAITSDLGARGVEVR